MSISMSISISISIYIYIHLSIFIYLFPSTYKVCIYVYIYNRACHSNHFAWRKLQKIPEMTGVEILGLGSERGDI